MGYRAKRKSISVWSALDSLRSARFADRSPCSPFSSPYAPQWEPVHRVKMSWHWRAWEGHEICQKSDRSESDRTDEIERLSWKMSYLPDIKDGLDETYWQIWRSAIKSKYWSTPSDFVMSTIPKYCLRPNVPRSSQIVCKLIQFESFICRKKQHLIPKFTSCCWFRTKTGLLTSYFAFSTTYLHLRKQKK